MALGTTIARLTGLGRILAMAFALGVTESRLADSYNLATRLRGLEQIVDALGLVRMLGARR